MGLHSLRVLESGIAVPRDLTSGRLYIGFHVFGIVGFAQFSVWSLEKRACQGLVL